MNWLLLEGGWLPSKCWSFCCGCEITSISSPPPVIGVLHHFWTRNPADLTLLELGNLGIPVVRPITLEVERTGAGIFFC